MKWISTSKILKQFHLSSIHTRRLAAQLKTWEIPANGKRYFDFDAASAVMPQFVAQIRAESARPGAVGRPHSPKGQQKLKLKIPAKSNGADPKDSAAPPARSDVNDPSDPLIAILRRIETKLDFMIALGIKPLSR